MAGSTSAVGPDDTALTAPPAAQPANPPNIVVFYVDDVSPHDGSLWSNPSRTPNFIDRFITHGVSFPRAVAEYPLCCPGRGSLLTGLHVHNHGVIDNDGRLMDPSEHIGKAMKEAGYASMWVGKLLNNVDLFTAEQWQAWDDGWTQLDAINEGNGAFYGFSLHTKQGTFKVKGVHSTKMVTDRTIMHMRETDPDQPIFAVLSIFDMHGPNIPQPQDLTDPRCDNFPPWKSGSYNEADVSDKPTPIQERALLADPTGWPMETYCREMLGIDRTIGQITAELKAEGRLNNTMLVFTADNGMAWGQHRLGENKSWPYATPVPLYVSWPAAGWGAATHSIPEIVSNIDLAPTFCSVAPTCQLGPFRWGVTAPDGVSIAPLLNGTASNLGRTAVLENGYNHEGWSWVGLRTTPLFDPNHRWHYIEYVNGFRELYDLVADPWELNNIASDSSRAALMATLQARLLQLRMEGVNAGQGSIKIAEIERPESGFDYSFAGDLGSFQLDDDADPALPNQQVFSNLNAGYYTITRSLHSRWSLTAISCSGVRLWDPAVARLTILVHPGENVACKFVDVMRRPDASIALRTDGTFKTNDFYSTMPTSKQTVRRDGIAIGSIAKYRFRSQNDSLDSDGLIVQATTGGAAHVSVRFFWADEDITAFVLGDGFEFASVAPSASREMRVEVKVGPGAPAATPFNVVLTVRSKSEPSVIDVARAITTH